MTLREDDVSLILRLLELPPALRTKIQAAENRSIALSAEEALQLGDLATEQLARRGFDENYALTADGRDL
jgi:hypothetical protein